MTMDNARINFEPHGWMFSGGKVYRVGTTTAQAFAGNYSLYASFKVDVPSMGQKVFVNLNQQIAGKDVVLHVYPPSGMRVSSIRAFVVESTGRATSSQKTLDGLLLGQWNTFTVPVPTDASPLSSLGVEFNFSSAWSGTAYIDSVDFVDHVSTDPVPAPSSSLPPPSSSLPPPSSSLPPPSSSLPPPSSSFFVLPDIRTVPWNPGLNAVGGIPVRQGIYKTLSPSGGDDTTTIQAALNTCPVNQVVLLTAGTFKITGYGLEVNRSNVVLRGSGPSTIITRSDTFSSANIIIGSRWMSDKLRESVNLTADGKKGSFSVTLASMPTNPYTVGEIVLIDSVTDPSITTWSSQSPPGNVSREWFCRPDRPVSQIFEISSVSGNTVMFTTPIYIDFLVSQAAQLSRYGETWKPAPVPAVKLSGIEDMVIEGGTGGDAGGNIHFFLAAYSWVKNVECRKSSGTSVAIDASFRCVVRDSYIHTSVDPNPGGAGYLTGINHGSSDNLLENNVVWNGNKVIVMRCSGGGNVIAYNYMQDAYGAGYKSWCEVGMNAAHMTTPHHELFEGNESFSFASDSVWGSALRITGFRNRLTGLRRSAENLGLVDQGNRLAIGLTLWHTEYSFVGNILGFTGMPLVAGQTQFVYEATPGLGSVSGFDNNNVVPMWKLGYDGSNSSVMPDPRVLATTIRHGNYDHVTNSVVWGSGSQLLPDSLYLTEKPAFFGSNPWPWINPSGSIDSDRVKFLPARARFDALHPGS